MSHTPEKQNRTVFITGAGTGIGAATALRFAKEGWDVILAGRRIEVLESMATKVRSKISEAFVLTLDISDTAAKATTAAWLEKNPAIAGRIHAVVHNAGIIQYAGTMASTDISWHETFETNLFGVIRITQALYPFVKKNAGVFVCVSSTLGLRPIPNTAAYSASKAALNNWAKSFAVEAAADKVRVNTICPGIIDTPIQSFHHAENRDELVASMAGLQPLGRIGRPEDVANMVWALAGPGSEWTTGAELVVDGGINLV